jgi:hypothetical protein
MQKVVIDMEEGWRWWPKVGAKIVARKPAGEREEREPVIELSDAFMSEYRQVSARFYEMQQHLEHCYRHQEGLKPFDDSPFKK